MYLYLGDVMHALSTVIPRMSVHTSKLTHLFVLMDVSKIIKKVLVAVSYWHIHCYLWVGQKPPCSLSMYILTLQIF